MALRGFVMGELIVTRMAAFLMVALLRMVKIAARKPLTMVIMFRLVRPLRTMLVNVLLTMYVSTLVFVVIEQRANSPHLTSPSLAASLTVVLLRPLRMTAALAQPLETFARLLPPSQSVMPLPRSTASRVRESASRLVIPLHFSIPLLMSRLIER